MCKIETYLKNNEVAYQIVDELMEFSNKGNDYLINSLIEDENSFVFVKKIEVIHKGFDDLVHWSTEDDTLCLVNDSILLCLPKDFKKN